LYRTCYTVHDLSFEDTVVQSEGRLPNATWQYGEDADLRLVRPPTALGPNTTTHGKQYVFEFASEESKDGFWQDICAKYEAGATYSFSVSLGLGQHISYNSIVALEFRTTDNVPIAVRSVLGVSLPEEAFVERSVTHQVPMDASYVDEGIRVGLRFSGTGFSPAIDDVHVCMTAEPT
jgi:hypothetical protein